MRVKLSDLQRIVQETIEEKRASDSFCNEIKRVFGPTVVVSDELESLVEQANYRLDVLERTGRRNYVSFSHSVAIKMLDHKNSQIRKLAARLLPEEYASVALNDKVSSVRAAAAKNCSLRLVENAAKKYPHDDLLFNVARQKRLLEEKNALKSAAEGAMDSDLSDGWYEKTARKLIHDYGHQLDTGWVPSAVNQICMSNRASNRLIVDPFKLMKKVTEILADEDKERLQQLEESSQRVYESYEEPEDEASQLIESNFSSADFIQKANKIFDVKMSEVPPAIRKYAIREGLLTTTLIPTVATLPHASFMRYSDEVALNEYVKRWNSQQSLNGQPFKLSWNPHPADTRKVSFSLELK